MSGEVVLVPECGAAIGLGHLERLLALADALTTRLQRVVVVVPPDSAVCDRVTARGHEPLAVAGGIADRAMAAVRLRPPSHVVVDAYTMPAAVQRDLSAVAPLTVVDDLGLECSCDLAINPSPGGMRLRPAGARNFLGGPDYALMSTAYRAARTARDARRTMAHRVLVSTGAMGFGGLGIAVSRALLHESAAVQVTLVLGPAAREPVGEDHEARIAIASSPESLAALLAGHDIYVGAAGTTAIQAACVGVPAVILPLVDNQRRQAAELAAAGCAVVATEDDASHVAADLLADASALESMSRAGRRLVDGCGAQRVASAVCSLAAEGARP